MRRRSLLAPLAIVLAMFGSGAHVHGQQTKAPAPTSQPSKPASPQPTGKKEYTFRGTVEGVNPSGKTLTVQNENIPGWMSPMSMAYTVSNPEILSTLKPGNRITARVYEGDMKLYQVRVLTTATTTKPPVAASDLPPLSYVCPSPGEEGFIDDKPGKCPQSGNNLIPIRLTIAYSCLRGPRYIQEKPGICEYDKADLVPVTASMFWVCKSDADKRHLEPGKCADASNREASFEIRPHGDHNPRHGGLAVFMSEDLMHHIEGTFVAPGVFRVYFYDEYTRPMKATGFSARAALADSNAREIGSPVALVIARSSDGNVMEARIPNSGTPTKAAPLDFKLHVKVKPDAKEWVTDYHFEQYSQEPGSVPSAVTTGAALKSVTKAATTAARGTTPANAAPASRAASGQTAPPKPPAPMSGGMSGGVSPDAAQSALIFAPQEKLPDTTPELIAELTKRSEDTATQLKQGALGSIWLPAIGTKDVALALENHVSELSDEQRSLFSSALMRLTQAAWQIDADGDLGNKEKLTEDLKGFAAAVADIKAVYGANR